MLNADETMVRLNASSSRVIAPKGAANIFQVTKDDKAGLTVMATFRADGVTCKPFIIYPFERIPSSVNSNFPHNEASISATKLGWMDSATFCNYLKLLANEIIAEGIKFPVILFVDNHASHTTLEACETAKKLGIVMIFLYPNSTFLLQPADVAIFRCLKSLWREENRLSKQKKLKLQNLISLIYS